MTSLIDQRILIPAPTHVIWSVLADQNQLPRWRVDCQAVAILTTRQFGLGMRRRCTPPKGKDQIEEVVAWYEGLGYEYSVVETRKYRSYHGRMRLQSVPDGTIVQWTITYEVRGIIGRILDSISGRAQLEEDSANSLRQLRRLVEGMGYTETGELRRRQTLQPVQSIVRSSTQPIPVPKEDAAADTKPRRPDGLDEAIQQSQQNQHDAPTATTATGATVATPPQPLRMMTPPEKITPVLGFPVVDPDAPVTIMPPSDDDKRVYPKTDKLPPGMPESLKATPPQGIPKVDVSRLRYADELDEELRRIPDERITEQTQILRPGLPLPPPTGARDTGEISIWEAFGIKPPSQTDAEALEEIVKRETGEHKKVVIEDDEDDDDFDDTVTFSPLLRPDLFRVRKIEIGEGLRLQQAREQVKVRRGKM